MRINVLELFSTATEVAAYGVIVMFVDALQSGGKLTFHKIVLSESVSNNQLLWFAAIGATLFFTVQAFFKFYSKKASLMLAKRYDKFCAMRLVQTLQQKGPVQLNGYRVKKAAVKDSRFCGAMLKSCASFLIPVVKILGSMAYMLYINFWISLLIILSLFFVFYLLQRQVKRTAQATQTKERLLPLYISNVVNRLNGVPSEKEKHNDRQNTTFSDRDTEEFYDAYYQVGILASHNLLIVQLCIAAMTFIILVLVGNYILHDSQQWGVLITFVIAMQYFFRNLRSLAGIAKQISQKIDYVVQYYTILQKIQLADNLEEFSSDSGQLGLQLVDADSDDDDFDDL